LDLHPWSWIVPHPRDVHDSLVSAVLLPFAVSLRFEAPEEGFQEIVAALALHHSRDGRVLDVIGEEEACLVIPLEEGLVLVEPTEERLPGDPDDL
jgi:hypothetical protein